MLPLHSLSFTVAHGELVPAWCTAHDLPWLRDLLHDAQPFAGRPQLELARRWRNGDPDPRAGRLLPAARAVLLALLQGPRRGAAHAALRHELFAAAATGSRDEALATVAARHGLPPATLLAQVFADLGDARAIVWPNPAPTPSDLLLATNRAIAAAVLKTATSAELQLRGHSRTVLRTAWLHGVYFTVVTHDADATMLRWRPPVGGTNAGGTHAGGTHTRGTHTGRHLAYLLPVLPWARWFELRAHCTVGPHTGTLVLTSHDALPPGPEPRTFDSRLEQRFAAAFAIAAPLWELLREPVPVRCGDQLAFPDFLLRRRGEHDGCWLEIAGLRDRSALAGKQVLLQQEARYVLCVPTRALTDSLRSHPRVVPFTRDVDVAAVLKCLSPLPP